MIHENTIETHVSVICNLKSLPLLYIGIACQQGAPETTCCSQGGKVAIDGEEVQHVRSREAQGHLATHVIGETVQHGACESESE